MTAIHKALACMRKEGPVRDELPAPVADPLLVHQGEPMCSKDFSLPASQCRQCGAFYCAGCLPEAARATLCPRCNTSRSVREAPRRLGKLCRELWIAPAIMGLGAFVGTSAVVLSQRGPLEAAIITGLLAGAPFFLVALLIGFTRALAMAWIGLVLELLLLLVMLQGGWLVFMIVAAVVPMMTAYQIFKIKDLRAIMKAHLCG